MPNNLIKDINSFEVVSEFKYLGITINSRTKITPHLSEVDIIFKNIVKKSHRLKGKGLQFRTRLDLYKIYLRPYFLYVAPAMKYAPSTSIKNLIQKTQTSMKWILNLSPFSPNKELLVALNLLHPIDLIKTSI